VAGDAFEVLKQLREAGEQYEVVVLDPPAFIKRRKDIKEGSVAYQRINRLAMQLLHPGGVLVSASCSWHLRRAELLEAMRKAAAISGQNLQVLEQGHQGPDHPVHPAGPSGASGDEGNRLPQGVFRPGRTLKNNRE